MQLPPESIIASGPVIIENDKVLLNKEYKPEGLSLWMFPGGEVERFDISLEEACMREVREELGIDVKIVKPLRPILLQQKDRVVVLIHFLGTRIGEVTPGPETAAWDWHDIRNLPPDCAPNVYTIINDYLEQL